MKVTFRAASPDEIVMELTAVMSVGCWRRIQQRLLRTPSVDGFDPVVQDFQTQIDQLIGKAEKHFRVDAPV